MADGYWTITSPSGETFKAKADTARLHRKVAEVADCNDPSRRHRVTGPPMFSAEIEGDG